MKGEGAEPKRTAAAAVARSEGLKVSGRLGGGKVSTPEGSEATVLSLKTPKTFVQVGSTLAIRGWEKSGESHSKGVSSARYMKGKTQATFTAQTGKPVTEVAFSPK